MSPRLQLNGLVMLYAYLQRVYVYDKVLASLPAGPGDVDPAPLGDLPGLLDRTGQAIKSFDTNNGLPGESVVELDRVVALVRGAMAHRAAAAQAPLRTQLAAVAGGQFHHQHLNDGLIHWGDRFHAETADRYRQRILLVKNDSREITGLVANAAGGALSDTQIADISRWYRDVVAATPGVDGDLTLISSLLHGVNP